MENAFGKGKTLWVGSFLALAYERQHDASTKQLMLALARAAGVTPEVEVSGPGTAKLEVRRLIGERAQFLFAFNHAANPADARITVRLPWPVREVRSLVDDQVVSYRETAGGLVLQKHLAGEETWVLRLARR